MTRDNANRPLRANFTGTFYLILAVILTLSLMIKTLMIVCLKMTLVCLKLIASI